MRKINSKETKLRSKESLEFSKQFFTRYLKEHLCYNSFRRYSMKDNRWEGRPKESDIIFEAMHRQDIREWIGLGFAWENTIEGSHYWNDQYEEFHDFMVDILYKSQHLEKLKEKLLTL